MHPFPHRYSVSVTTDATKEVTIESPGLAALPSAPPAEFDGPGNRWSPETLLVAALIDCFVLTFRAMAAVSKLSWLSLDCETTGVVDKVERVGQFTSFEIRARLRIPAGANKEQAERLLVRAEQTCPITNSLKVVPRLNAVVEDAPSLNG